MRKWECWMLTTLTLKDISTLKRKLNWGELPPFFHMVSNSLADLEGVHTHGFEHALKNLVDRENWNLTRLQGTRTLLGDIRVARKPRITLYQRFHEQDFEIYCAPISQGGPVMVYAKGDPFIDFLVWDPSRMSHIVRLPQFQQFIIYAYQRGDKADRLLVHFASNIIDMLLQKLQIEIDVDQYKGESLKQLITEVEQRLDEIAP